MWKIQLAFAFSVRDSSSAQMTTGPCFSCPMKLETLQTFCAALAAQHRFLLQFSLSCGPCILLQRTTVNVAFILTAFAESAGNVLRLAYTVSV